MVLRPLIGARPGPEMLAQVALILWTPTVLFVLLIILGPQQGRHKTAVSLGLCLAGRRVRFPAFRSHPSATGVGGPVGPCHSTSLAYCY